MSESDLYRSFVGLFVEIAQAHHQATGEVNPEWADWYADRMIGSLREMTGSEMSQSELRDWLVAADVRFNGEPRISVGP